MDNIQNPQLGCSGSKVCQSVLEERSSGLRLHNYSELCLTRHSDGLCHAISRHAGVPSCRALTACCIVGTLAFMKSPLGTLERRFDSHPPEESQLGRSRAGFKMLSRSLCLSPTPMQMYLHMDRSLDVCALKHAVVVCFFKNAIKARYSTVGFFRSKEWASLHS